MAGFAEGWTQWRPGLARLKTSAVCRRDTAIKSSWDAIGWWEARRVPFNLIVGIAGIFSCIVAVVVGLGSYFLFHGELPLPGSPGLSLMAIILYAVLANLCFTGGWVAEIVVRKLWPHEADRFATLSFCLGVVFSVLLTLTPAIVLGAAGILGLVGHLLGVTRGT
jgi:ABC-type branched-subunit amino acid transport system permease subunit